MNKILSALTSNLHATVFAFPGAWHALSPTIKGLVYLLIAFTVFFVAYWWKVGASHEEPAVDPNVPPSRHRTPTALEAVVGFIANFFDTLGIGSFATTASMFKLFGDMVPDGLIPGTLNVGHTLPTVTEAFIFLILLGGVVAAPTLVLMIGAAVVGAWFGAGIVSRLPQRQIRIGLGFCLLAAAILIVGGGKMWPLQSVHFVPGGGEAAGLTGAGLIAGIVGSLFLGALMPLGIGFYAPCMVLVYLLGMNEKAAFPIMMGACAFLMPVGSARFVRSRKYRFSSARGLTLGGIPGVILAAFLVVSLPLEYLFLVVVVVVIYTAYTLLHAAFRTPATAKSKQAEAS